MGGQGLLAKERFVIAISAIGQKNTCLKHLPPRYCDQTMEVMLRHLLAPGHSHGGYEVDTHANEGEHHAEEHMEAAEYTLDLR
jgi:hypothetical protein